MVSNASADDLEKEMRLRSIVDVARFTDVTFVFRLLDEERARRKQAEHSIEALEEAVSQVSGVKTDVQVAMKQFASIKADWLAALSDLKAVKKDWTAALRRLRKKAKEE